MNEHVNIRKLELNINILSIIGSRKRLVFSKCAFLVCFCAELLQVVVHWGHLWGPAAPERPGRCHQSQPQSPRRLFQKRKTHIVSGKGSTNAFTLIVLQAKYKSARIIGAYNVAAQETNLITLSTGTVWREVRWFVLSNTLKKGQAFAEIFVFF